MLLCIDASHGQLCKRTSFIVSKWTNYTSNKLSNAEFILGTNYPSETVNSSDWLKGRNRPGKNVVFRQIMWLGDRRLAEDQFGLIIGWIYTIDELFDAEFILQDDLSISDDSASWIGYLV